MRGEMRAESANQRPAFWSRDQIRPIRTRETQTGTERSSEGVARSLPPGNSLKVPSLSSLPMIYEGKHLRGQTFLRQLFPSFAINRCLRQTCSTTQKPECMV